MKQPYEAITEPKPQAHIADQWISGVIIAGSSRGKVLGFPTANVLLDRPSQQPPVGIYAAWVKLPPHTTAYPAAVHVGPRPTFNEDDVTVEVHIINFPDESLYGQDLEIKFVQKIRDVEKFNSAAELTYAIDQDCKKTLEILK